MRTVVDYFLTHFCEPEFKITLRNAKGRFLDAKERDGLRGRSRTQLDSVVTRFESFMENCHVHEVTPALDDGPILGQARLQVQADDTPEGLAHRVLALEHQLYPAVLRRFAAQDKTPVWLDAAE